MWKKTEINRMKRENIREKKIKSGEFQELRKNIINLNLF